MNRGINNILVKTNLVLNTAYLHSKKVYLIQERMHISKQSVVLFMLTLHIIKNISYQPKIVWGQFLSSHLFILLIYNRSTLEPSEVILLMAGAQPRKMIMWDAALKLRPKYRYPVLIIRFGWCRNAPFDVNSY